MWGIFRPSHPGEGPGAAGQQPQAGGIIFLTGLQDNLGPQADAQDGDAPGKALRRARSRPSSRSVAIALPAAPTPGKMTRLAWATTAGSWVTGALHPQGFERPDYTGEVAGLIINNDDHGILEKKR